jgi:hypothetical protein
MNGTRFDQMMRNMTEEASRRRLLGGLLGGAAMLTGAALARTDDADAKKGGNGKGKGKGNGKGKGKGKPKVQFCHATDEGGYVFISVGAPAAKAHRNHKGKVDVECVADPCKTYDKTCGVDGTCGFTPAAVDTACVAEGGVPGLCDEAGTCVPNPVEEE